MDCKVPHPERLNAPFCSFVRQPACLRRRPPGGLMASDVRHSALGRVRGDAAIASAMVAQPDGPSGPAGWPRDAPSPEAGKVRAD